MSDPSRPSAAGTSSAVTNDSKEMEWTYNGMIIMHVPLIMDLIAPNLATKDLVRLRPTCKLWNRSFSPLIKKNHNTIALNAYGNKHDEPVETFVEIMEKSQDILFHRFKIQANTYPSTNWHTWLNRLLVISGINITLLDLKWRNENLPISEVRKLIFELTPNVQELKLSPDFKEEVDPVPNLTRQLRSLRSLEVFTAWQINPSFTVVAVDIVGCAESLECLRLWRGNDGHFLWTVLSALAINENIHKLKVVQIHGIRSEELLFLIDMASMGRNPLRLEELTLCLNWFNGFADPFLLLRQFLSLQKTSLTKLTLEVQSQEFSTIDVLLQIPPMEKLAKITFPASLNRVPVEYEGGSPEDLAPNPNNFPKLERLSMEYIHPTSAEAMNQIVSPNYGVRTLQLDIPSEDLEFFGSNFPSVELLKIYLNENESSGNSGEQQLQRIWNTWPLLTRLEITPSAVDIDLLLSGIARYRMHSIQDILDSFDGTMTLDALRALEFEFKTRKSVGDFDRLQTLVVNIYGVQNGVSDIGGYLGLALAGPRLQRVEVIDHVGNQGWFKKKNSMSEKCRSFVQCTLGVGVLLEL